MGIGCTIAAVFAILAAAAFLTWLVPPHGADGS